MISLQDTIDANRQLFSLLRDEQRKAKSRGDFAYAAQLHRCSMQVSARISLLEKARRLEEHSQITLLPGRAGRRHDDGDAA